MLCILKNMRSCKCAEMAQRCKYLGSGVQRKHKENTIDMTRQALTGEDNKDKVRGKIGVTYSRLEFQSCLVQRLIKEVVVRFHPSIFSTKTQNARSHRLQGEQRRLCVYCTVGCVPTSATTSRA